MPEHPHTELWSSAVEMFSLSLFLKVKWHSRHIQCFMDLIITIYRLLLKGEACLLLKEKLYAVL